MISRVRTKRKGKKITLFSPTLSSIIREIVGSNSKIRKGYFNKIGVEIGNVYFYREIYVLTRHLLYHKINHLGKPHPSNPHSTVSVIIKFCYRPPIFTLFRFENDRFSGLFRLFFRSYNRVLLTKSRKARGKIIEERGLE